MAYKRRDEGHQSVRIDPQDMNESKALYEAQRCLYCFDAPCTQACPTHIDVPGFIKRLAEHNWQGASHLLYQANPMAGVCGLVCPTESLCENACVLTGIGQQPIRIGALQYFVSSLNTINEPLPEKEITSKIAVIGGGPSGLGCSVALRREGYQVVVFEQEQTLGGLTSQVIPEYRLPQQVIDHDLARLEAMGIEFRLGARIDQSELDVILAEFDGVFLGIGLHASRNFVVPGSDLPGVMPAIDFLAAARKYGLDKKKKPDIGERVVVIGGGNVALDAAINAKQLGAERVTVVYRRSLLEMPAWQSEFLEASSLGVEFLWLSKVTDIQGENHVTRISIQPMRFGDDQRGGKPWIEKDPELDPYQFRCETVLLALGQQLEKELVNSLNLEFAPDGTIKTRPDSYQTANPKIFTAGDASGTGATVVESVAKGMESGQAIHHWLSR